MKNRDRGDRSLISPNDYTCPLRSLTDINSEIELDTKTLETLWHTWICLPILSERY